MAQPAVTPVTKPLSLIPVGLKEAALDSPSFRSTVVHISTQVDAVEVWLDGYVKAASKLSQEVGVLEDVVNGFLSASNPPEGLSEAALDHDYTLLAVKRYGQGAHDYWSHAIGGFKKCQHSVVEPIRATLLKDFRPFKDVRRILEQTQRQYDTVLARYASQTRMKEASSLREDAFQLHEARKAYLKSSMDFCIAAPQLRAALDTLLIKVFSDQWLEMKDLRETTTTMFSGYGHEIERIRNWSQQINQGEAVLRQELLATRKQIEESAEMAIRPSRDLDEYTASTASTLMTRPRANSRVAAEGSSASSKQGWLFMRTTAGRPARTTWTRRWFYVKNGVFGWLTQGSKSGGVEESEKIGVLLCNIRAAALDDRRFCFEVKTKDTMLMLQAETQGELSRWLSVFDTSKKKALEDPVLGDAQVRRMTHSTDAAFAVSPAFSPELAEKRTIDANVAGVAEDSPMSPVAAEDELTSLDRTDSGARRRRTINNEGDTSREHAARLLSKLDLHRKTSAATGASNRNVSASMPSSPAPPQGFVTSASASRHSLPSTTASIAPNNYKVSRTPPMASSLAPMNIACPPVPTNLSKTAVMVVAERGLDTGAMDLSGGGAPSSLLANQWGTANYGQLSRLDRGEISRPKASVPDSPPIAAVQGPQTTAGTLLTQAAGISPPILATKPVTGHRKTVSEAEGQLVQARASTISVNYEASYPSNLRIHDAQLRLLFPNVPADQRVLLVFRASWNPSNNQDLPGRVYVTNSEVYFYSHYHGFVLVTGFGLDRLLSISAETKSHHDFLYFTLRSLHGRDTVHTVTAKVFLEPLQLLRRRLQYIVSTYKSEESVSQEEMIMTLINLDNDSIDPGIAPNEWDASKRPRFYSSPVRGAPKASNLRVDRSLYGGDSTSFVDQDTQQFKLPAQAVDYRPQDVDHLAVEGIFDISAKAMASLIFGDKSAVSQMLYFQRRTQVITQQPWTPVEGGYWSRRFEYDVVVHDLRGHPETILISDSQTIDVFSDHLCYSVTDLKTPWHLPRPKDFSLVTKIVITHVAKSRCKLAIFSKVQWHERTGLADRIIEVHALEDLRTDAIALKAMVADQVSKLSTTDAQTRRAVEIFGHVGHVTEPAQITCPEVPFIDGKVRTAQIMQVTMASLVVEAALIYLQAGLTRIVDILMQLAQTSAKAIGAHSILMALLALSLSIHLLGSSTLLQSWYADRNAASYMSRLGVSPDVSLSKTLWLHDVLDLSRAPPIDGKNESNVCVTAFHNLISSSTSPSVSAGPDFATSTSSYTTSTASTARRLAKTRTRMATYRHDLLVSLRLVNRIEHETLQAEYEHWLGEETEKCHKVSDMIASLERGARKATTEELVRKVEKLRQWRDGYCGSCKSEMERIGGEYKEVVF